MKLSPKSIRVLSCFVSELENPRDKSHWETWRSGADRAEEVPPRIARIAASLAELGILRLRDSLGRELSEDQESDAANDLELLKSIHHSLQNEPVTYS